MNDKDLSALIRMAQEAQQLEDGAPYQFRWAAPDQTRRSQVRTNLARIGVLAAAACLGLAAVAWLRPQPAPVPGPVARHEAPAVVEATTTVAAALPKASPLGSVLLAVFRDAEDRCSCIQLNAADFQGDLANIGSSELFRTAMESSCHENPQQVLVIAMQGPRDRLPTSTAEAEMLASAVRDTSGHCGDDACLTETAGSFLPEGVTAVAGSIALR